MVINKNLTYMVPCIKKYHFGYQSLLSMPYLTIFLHVQTKYGVKERAVNIVKALPMLSFLMLLNC